MKEIRKIYDRTYEAYHFDRDDFVKVFEEVFGDDLESFLDGVLGGYNSSLHTKHIALNAL